MTALLLPPAPPEAEKAYAMRLITEFQAVDLLKDADAWDAYISSLDDYDWLIYQQWRNRPRSEHEALQYAFDDAALGVDTFNSAMRDDCRSALRSFGIAAAPVIDALKQWAATCWPIADLLPISESRIRLIESMTRYALAGHPFGKSHKGRKRWLLEQKRRAG
jgi:hypothetical protein